LKRINRHGIYQLCLLLHKLPEEIENMDYEWYRDMIAFSNTDSLVSKIKGSK